MRQYGGTGLGLTVRSRIRVCVHACVLSPLTRAMCQTTGGRSVAALRAPWAAT
jgi:hypothetical protein